MELKVWVDGAVRVVCGLSEETSCQDVVIALAQAIGEYYICGFGLQDVSVSKMARSSEKSANTFSSVLTFLHFFIIDLPKL